MALGIADEGRQPSVAGEVVAGRSRKTEAPTDRVRRDGKFFRLGAEKFFVKGVTYGPFAPGADGHHLPAPDVVRRDFELIRELNANCIRIYHVPPVWFLDLADECGLKVFLDVAWPKNMLFVGDEQITRQAHKAVRDAARSCGNHPAIFAISVVNEIPPDIVRFVGKERVEQFVDDLVAIVKQEAPHCLATFANFPTTEYLNPRSIDFVCYNVYLHDPAVFRNYLARLQMIAGEKPLMLGEYGIDTMHEKTEEDQAHLLGEHVKAVFDEGLVGTFIFSFTDDWFTGGWQIDNWAFGLVKRDRTPKASFERVKALFARAPQVADDKLPRCSVIVCSYNGASTTEACLRSLEKLRYPDYEVIFVDDGSTDNTQEILKKFPWVRNIRQANMGLSYARNVGMHAATGEIIVYTDSDCEADEDWLYYIALTLTRSRHAGIGGPNLIPDEGSWVADCVGLSPGGPTHVMIDDRTAEHVPGCNMAFYRWAALEINGFDPQFRSAGDDVDFIWRLQHRGHSIGFAPSAQVWHYRRNTIKAYLKQQRGYGAAEAMLKYKHPDHFNALGASFWRGKIYGTDEVGVRVGGDVVYHGVFGTGLFQTIYRKPASLLAAMLMSVEWHMLYVFVAMIGVALSSRFWPPAEWSPILWIAVLMFLTPFALAITAAAQAPMPRHRSWLTRPLIAYLHWRQPLTRGWARYSVRLKQKVMNGEVHGFGRPALPFDRNDKRTLRYWARLHDRIPLLQRIVEEVKQANWRMRVDSGWAPWDLEIYGSRYCKVRLTTATEHYGDQGNLTRVRVELLMSKFCCVLFVASAVLAAIILLAGFPNPHLWPFARPAVLIPIAWWTMYAVNKARVSEPVLGLVDLAAERAGYTPILDEKKQSRPRAAEIEDELEEHEAGLV